MRYATIKIRGYGSDTWTDSRDFDPILLPRVVLPGGVVIVPVDFDPLNHLTEILANEEAERQVVSFDLVWDDLGTSVKAACAACGNISEVVGEMLCDEDTLACHNCL